MPYRSPHLALVHNAYVRDDLRTETPHFFYTQLQLAFDLMTSTSLILHSHDKPIALVRGNMESRCSQPLPVAP